MNCNGHTMQQLPHPIQQSPQSHPQTPVQLISPTSINTNKQQEKHPSWEIIDQNMVNHLQHQQQQ